MTKVDFYMQKKNDLISSLRFFKKAIQLIGSLSRCYVWVQLFLTIVLNVSPVLSLLIMQMILNALQLAFVDIMHIIKLILIYVFLDLIQSFIQALANLYTSKVELNFNLWLKKKLLLKTASLSVQDFEASETYDLIRRAQYAENGSIIYFVNTSIQIIGVLISSLSYLLILFTLDIKLLPCVLFVPIIKYIISVKINNKRFALVYNRAPDERKQWYWSFLLTNGVAVKELKLNNLADFFVSEFEKLTNIFNNQDYNLSKKSIIQMLIFTLIEQIIDGCIFLYIILRGIGGEILIGSVVTYTRSIIQAKSSVKNILSKYAEVKRHELNISQIYQLLDLTEEETTNSGIKITSLESIEINNLSYRYKCSKKYVLKNISFKMKKGDVFALVGANGSGKSTLSKILLGLYLDYEGEILINGIELRKLDIKAYRNLCGGLFQDFLKYEATVAENIMYGSLELLNNECRINEIYDIFKLNKLSPAEDRNKILQMQLGHWFEKGKQISIGQWQRLALSRVFAKEAELYILDEPSASLDSLSEKELLCACFSEMKTRDKIGIIIVHRLQNIERYANYIIVLENGEIVEMGASKELIDKGGKYKELYQY